METHSSFQLQHPLSPKKFWKKMIEKIIPILFISLFLGGLLGGIIGKLTDDFNGFYFLMIIPAFIMVFGLYGWFVKVYIERYYYDCSESIITIKKKVFTPTEIHVQYQKIQDVYVDQDLLDRIMGIYDVHIASATYSSGIEAHIDGVEKDVADRIKNYFLAKMQNKEVAHQKKDDVSTKVEESRAGGGNHHGNSSAVVGTGISSKNYPISDKWMTMATVNSVFIGLYSALMFCLVFGGAFLRGSRYTYTSSSSPSVNWRALIVVFIVITVIGFAIAVVRNIIWKKNFYFEFTPDYVLRKTSVISTHETHLPYKSIQDVILKQGIIEKIFGLGTVLIQNAAQNGFQMPRGSIFAMASAAQNRNGVTVVGLPYEKARELSDILNEIVRKKGDASRSMGV